MTPAEKELVELLSSPFIGSPDVRWANGFTVRDPKDLGRSLEGRLLRQLYKLTLRVRSRRPFDLRELSAQPGQSLADWLEQGIAAFERWLAEGDHLGDEAEDASAKSVVHGESHRRGEGAAT